MLKGARVPERAYKIVLWVVSVVFAGFIVGLGNLVIGDLPQMERTIAIEQFQDRAAILPIDKELKSIDNRRGEIDVKLEIARLQLEQAQSAATTGEEAFQAWIQTRQATTNPQQDPELLARTRQLEQLMGNQRAVQTSIDELNNERLALDQRSDALSGDLSKLEDKAWPAYERAMFWQELRIFGLRLALALPMLLIAAWLVIKKRKSDYWPISRGFVLAAVFVFFVELVPYLPSYGGYIRYGVGIVLTFAAGHFLIKNMRYYLANRQEVEAKAEAERRKLVSHDEAFKKMSSKVCPGCDRPIAAMEGSETNFCVHCGMTLFNECSSCGKRKMAFFRYCMSCGTTAENAERPEPA